MSFKLLIGSNNAHKAEELFRVVKEAQLPFQILLPSEVTSFPTVIEETGATLEENAYIKAVTIYQTTGIPALADDTGLEIDALGGAPGVYSARYAGENATYSDNVQKVLQQLSNVPNEQRTAKFRTVLCFYDGFRTLFAEGEVHGKIGEKPVGEHGFGYDPIFTPHGKQHTFAQMSQADKDALSHRGNALRAWMNVVKMYVE
jgi:XTP/dITP diphosphohydrolase